MGSMFEDLKAGVAASPKRAAALAVSAAVIITQGFAAAVSAQEDPPADPTAGAAGELQSGITDWITGQGLPMLVALMVLGAVIAILIKFGRKARSQV